MTRALSDSHTSLDRAPALTRRIGEDAIYYRSSGHGWITSSSIAALRRLEPRITSLDLRFLATQALGLAQYDTSTRTCWEGIHRLLPGHTLVVSSTGALSQVRNPLAPLEARQCTPARLNDLLARSTRAPRDAIVCMSSGVDSTLLAMLRARDASLDVAAMTFEDSPSCDESSAVRRIAELLDARTLTMVPVDRWTTLGDTGFEEDLLELGPMMHPGSVYEDAFFSTLEERLEIRDMIMGVGADQLLALPTIMAARALARRGRARELLAWRATIGGRALAHALPGVVFPRAGHDRARALDAVRALLPPWGRVSAIPDAAVDGMQTLSRVSADTKRARRAYVVEPQAFENMCTNITRLRRRHPRCTFHFPFLEPEVWETFLNCDVAGCKLPGRPRPPHYWDKVLIRRAHELLGALPPSVSWAGKAATMAEHVGRSLLISNVDRVMELSRDMRLDALGIIRQGVWRDAVVDFRNQCNDDPRALLEVGRFWPVLAVESWVRRIESRLHSV